MSMIRAVLNTISKNISSQYTIKADTYGEETEEAIKNLKDLYLDSPQVITVKKLDKEINIVYNGYTYIKGTPSPRGVGENLVKDIDPTIATTLVKTEEPRKPHSRLISIHHRSYGYFTSTPGH